MQLKLYLIKVIRVSFEVVQPTIFTFTSFYFLMFKVLREKCSNVKNGLFYVGPFYVYCVRSVQIRNYFWSVFSCIRIEYRYLLTQWYFWPLLSVFSFIFYNLNYISKKWLELSFSERA